MADLEGGQHGIAFSLAEKGQHLGGPWQQRLKRHALPPGPPLLTRIRAVSHHRQQPRHRQPRLSAYTNPLINERYTLFYTQVVQVADMIMDYCKR